MLRPTVAARRGRQGQAEQGAQLGQEELVVGPLGAGGGGPAIDEGVDEGGREAVVGGRGSRGAGDGVGRWMLTGVRPIHQLPRVRPGALRPTGGRRFSGRAAR